MCAFISFLCNCFNHLNLTISKVIVFLGVLSLLISILVLTYRLHILPAYSAFSSCQWTILSMTTALILRTQDPAVARICFTTFTRPSTFTGSPSSPALQSKHSNILFKTI